MRLLPSYAFLFLTATCLVGCCGVQQVQVPADARLMFYGNAFGDNPNSNMPVQEQSGRVYLYDDQTGRVEAVLPVTQGSTFNFNGIPTGHKIRIYFQPDPPMTPAATQSLLPTTRQDH